MPDSIPKVWYLSRTLWLNAIAFVVAVLTLPNLGAVVPSSWLPGIGLLTAIGNMALRFATTQPLSTPTAAADAAAAERRSR
jgi:hypothetical protein